MLTETIRVATRSRTSIEIITGEVQRVLDGRELAEGLCTLFTPHTTAALAINENADPDVPRDLTEALAALVPQVDFRHAEGNSDAHLLSTLIGVSLTIPIRKGRLGLGRWQGIYLIELDGPRTREVQICALG